MGGALKMLFAIMFLWHPFSTLGQRGDQDMPNTPEAVASSLIFVFDITGSMKSELNQVKTSAKKILNQVNENLKNNQERMIDDFILVPFDDPEVKNVTRPVTRTDNITLFEETLKGLKIGTHGKGCAELSLDAIKRGLELGRLKSLLFVFTDADPRDIKLLPDVLNLITDKLIKVIFILTGYCNHNKGASPEFRQIATESNGQIFDINKSDLSQVLSFIHFEVKPRKVDLVSVDVSEPRNIIDKKFDVPVDNTITELILSLATKKGGEFRVTNPVGSEYRDYSFCNNSLSVDNTRLCSVQNPIVGNWSVLLITDSSFSLRVFGSSNITLDFGFEVVEQNRTTVSNTTSKVLCHPIAGTENTFLLKLNGTSQVKTLISGEIVSLDGRVAKNFTFELVEGYTDLYRAPFVPINSTYHLQVNGITKNGTNFRRLTSVAFSSTGTNNQNSTQCIARALPFIKPPSTTNATNAAHTANTTNANNQPKTFSSNSWCMYTLVTMALTWKFVFLFLFLFINLSVTTYFCSSQFIR